MKVGFVQNDPPFGEVAKNLEHMVRVLTGQTADLFVLPELFTTGYQFSGEDIVLRLVVKPTSSINKTQDTVTLKGKKATISVEGRHDPCICPRAVPIAEAMVALTLVDHLLRQQLSHLKK